MKCLVLASGFGMRVYPLAVYKAKALLEYKGKPVLTHIVEKMPADIEVFVCYNPRFERDFCEWQRAVGRQVEICVEDIRIEEAEEGSCVFADFLGEPQMSK